MKEGEDFGRSDYSILLSSGCYSWPISSRMAQIDVTTMDDTLVQGITVPTPCVRITCHPCSVFSYPNKFKSTGSKWDHEFQPTLERGVTFSERLCSTMLI